MMRLPSTLQLAGALAALAALVSFAFTSAGAQGETMPIRTVENTEVAIFAGGCFWCVESDFDKVEGVLETVSGYIGGRTDEPTYRSHGKDGHLEAVRIVYDPSVVSYEELVSHYFRTIDPTDAGGQFCDRGNSYTTAVFALSERQAEVARSEKAAIEASGVLDAPIVTTVRDASTFWPAEEYHQDYYLKQPLKYKFYRQACGRDERVDEVWRADMTG